MEKPLGQGKFSAVLNEQFIAWRYLYRKRQSRGLRIATLLVFLTALFVQLALFGLGWTHVGVFLTLPTMLTFLVLLLLNFFSVFTTISMVGVMLGVTALTVVLSVTSGFEQSFRDKVLGVNAHLLVLKYGLDFREYRDTIAKLKAVPHVQEASPFVFNEMMLARGTTLAGVLVKGIDPVLSPRVIDIASKLTSGKMEDLNVHLPPNDGPELLPAIFIGKELQTKLHAKIGDRLRVVSPKTNLEDPDVAHEGGLPPVREFRVAGVFYAGFDEYDRRLTYVHIKDAQTFYQGRDVVTGIEMKLDDSQRARDVAGAVSTALDNTLYRIIDWEELNHTLFAAIRTQKTVLAIVLNLIIIVAAFNIVAAMTMMVIDKSREIAIFKSMGLTASRVARIFQWAGLTIGGTGITLGLGLGLLLCAIVRRYDYLLDAQVYLIDRMPVKIQPLELIFTMLVTLAICFLATIYPSLRAAWLSPVDGLRKD